MAPRRCIGYTPSDNAVTVSCVFSMNEGSPGTPAHGQYIGRCVWCNPEEIQRRCGVQRLRKLLVYSLQRLRKINSVESDIFEKACARLPLEWAQEIREAASPREPLAELGGKTFFLPPTKLKRQRNNDFCLSHIPGCFSLKFDVARIFDAR